MKADGLSGKIIYGVKIKYPGSCKTPIEQVKDTKDKGSCFGFSPDNKSKCGNNGCGSKKEKKITHAFLNRLIDLKDLMLK